MKNLLPFTFLILILFSNNNSQAQSWKWARGSSAPFTVLESWQVAVDRNGNVYEAGYPRSFTIPDSSIICYFGTDSVVAPHSFLLVSTDSDGNYRWELGACLGKGIISNIVTDTNNNLYVFGYYQSVLGVEAFAIGTDTIRSSTTGLNVFCAKISSSGNVIWLKNLTNDHALGGYGGLDAAGNIYVLGEFENSTVTIGSTTINNRGVPILSTDMFLVKTDSAFNPIWAKGIVGDSTETIVGISVCANGDVIVGGSFNSHTLIAGPDTLRTAGGSNPDFFITKFDTYGNQQWGKQIHPKGLSFFFGLATYNIQ